MINYIEEESTNKCIICGIDLGACNSRQLCCKTYCPKEFEYLEDIQIDKTNETHNETNETHNETNETHNENNLQQLCYRTYCSEDTQKDTQEDTQKEFINKCVICGVDLGACNPRQLCCKTYCPKEFENMDNERYDF
jgi:hypothetical protein